LLGVPVEHRPSFTSEPVTSILSKTEGQAQMLILLAAATGLRETYK